MSGKRHLQEATTRLVAVSLLCALVLFGLAALLPSRLPSHDSLPLSASHAVVASPNTTIATTAKREPGVLYVSDIYVPGHARAHPELCPNQGADLRLLILVTSAPSHASARDAVRLTWGHFRARTDVVIAFVLGQAPPALEADLIAEDELYGDLIFGNSIDSYSNLTLKTISMLEWTLQYCSRVLYLLKTDDDMFINVPQLLSFLDNAGNASRTMWGRVVYKALPIRSSKSKFYISYHDWADKVFPDYATGPAYLMTVDCVRPLLYAAVAPLRRFIFLEDVFVTGVLATELGIRRVFASAFYNPDLRPTSDPCEIRNTIAVHEVLYHQQFEYWQKLLDNQTQCCS